MRQLRRLPKAANYRSGHCAAYSVPPLILPVKGKGSDVNRNEGAALETEGEAEPFGSSDSRVQQASVHADRIAGAGAAEGRSMPTLARVRNTGMAVKKIAAAVPPISSRLRALAPLRQIPRRRLARARQVAPHHPSRAKLPHRLKTLVRRLAACRQHGFMLSARPSERRAV